MKLKISNKLLISTGDGDDEPFEVTFLLLSVL